MKSFKAFFEHNTVLFFMFYWVDNKKHSLSWPNAKILFFFMS